VNLPVVARHDDGAVCCETILWRFRGRLQLTVVVKALFCIVVDDVATHAGPAPILAEDQHRDGHPARSLEAANNLAPYLPRCDVVFTGHAHALSGPSATAAVRLGIARDGRLLLDKTIYVFGDRDAAEKPPEPFVRMPIVYERACGGIVGHDNPVGKQVPNLVDPKDPSRATSFGPTLRYWPARKRLLEGLDSKQVDAKVPEIPETMRWAYFQAAPPDQQIDYLVGGEWLVLDGLHPSRARVQTRLPSVSGAARIAILKDGVVATERSVELACDTVAIDGDQQSFSLVWRGSYEVPDEEPPPTLAVLAALETPGVPIDWSKILAGAARPSAVPATTKGVPAFRATAMDLGEAARKAALPFASAASAASVASRLPSVPATGKRPLQSGATMALSLNDFPPQPEALPFGSALQRDPLPAPLRAETAPPIPAPLIPTSLPRAEPPPPSPPIATASRSPTRTVLGIEVFCDAALSMDVSPWGVTPTRDLLTVIAKATCDLVPEGPAVPRRESDPLRGEGPLYPSDLAPYKVRADIVLVGHAIASGGAATSMDLGLSFGSEGNAFVRRAVVFGDRTWVKRGVALEPSTPESFAAIPVTYERAFGGPRYPPNPVGIGHRQPMQRGPAALPNLEDPEELLRCPSQSPPPTAFAPVPLSLKDALAARGDGPVCLAEALDWARFQAAPRVQQLAFLRGDEPYAITGFSLRGVVTGALPGLRAQCFALHRADDRLEEVKLELDTVVFDLDQMKVDLVWRGALAVADETSPDVAAMHLLASMLGAEMSLEDARTKLLPSSPNPSPPRSPGDRTHA
jgi:hypothetical protein